MFHHSFTIVSQYDPAHKCLLHGQEHLVLRPGTNKGATIAMDYSMFPC